MRISDLTHAGESINFPKAKLLEGIHTLTFNKVREWNNANGCGEIISFPHPDGVSEVQFMCSTFGYADDVLARGHTQLNIFAQACRVKDTLKLGGVTIEASFSIREGKKNGKLYQNIDDIKLSSMDKPEPAKVYMDIEHLPF